MKKGMVVFTQSTEIIGVVKEGVIVEGFFDDDEDGDDVKLLITKEQYFTLLNDWMIEKQDYCDRYGYMCGQGGNFIIFGDFDEVTMLGEEMLDGRKCEVDDIDMEHG
jgi:hypothetical protein